MFTLYISFSGVSVQVNTSVSNTELTISEKMMLYWHSLLEEKQRYFGAQNTEDIIVK